MLEATIIIAPERPEIYLLFSSITSNPSLHFVPGYRDKLSSQFPIKYRNIQYLVIITNGCINVTTLKVKHYNDLLKRRSSGRASQGWSHILLCWGRFLYIPLALCMSIFKKKKKKNLPLKTLLQWKVWVTFSQTFQGRFLGRKYPSGITGDRTIFIRFGTGQI